MAEVAEEVKPKVLSEDEQWEALIQNRKNGTTEVPPPEKEEKPKEEDEPEEKKPDSEETPAGEEQADEPEKKDEEESQDTPDIDSQIKEWYGEDYEITSRQELDEVLEATEKVLEENDRLKAELESAGKAKEPEFASDAQKKAYEFIKNYDPEQHSDALETWARVVRMDTEKADGKAILRENYVLSKPEMNRQDAIEKFERDYARKYQPKKEKFDSDEEYEEAKKDAEIDLKADIASARKAIKDKQKDFKYTPTEKEKETKEPEIPQEVQTSIAKNVKNLEDYHKDFTEIIYIPEDKDEYKFPIKFTKDQISQIKNVAKNWVSNPLNYDKTGKLAIDWDQEEATTRAAELLFGKAIKTKLWEHAKQVFSTKRAEEISTMKPDRVSKVTNATVKEKSEDEQWDAHIANKKKK